MDVYINEDALRINARLIQELNPDHIPVIKGNWYGMGSHLASKILGPSKSVVAAANFQEAYDLLYDGAFDKVLLLCGVHKRRFGRPWNPKMVPVVGNELADYLRLSGLPYAMYDASGCIRYAAASNINRDSAEYILYHSHDYSTAYEPETTSTCNQEVSVGSSSNLGTDQPMIRVGQAYTGYGPKHIKLRVVKTVYADIMGLVYSDSTQGNKVGYDYSIPEGFKYIYMIDVGNCNYLYSSINSSTVLHCPTKPDARIELFSDPRAICMNNAYVGSDTELDPISNRIELLGPHVRADYLADLHGTSVANILRLDHTDLMGDTY